jgi:hypothetical protein
MSINSESGDISFLSTLNSDAANRSLTLNALQGKVTFTDTLGYLSPSRSSKGPSVYDLTVNAKDILLKGDIYTLSNQVFNGAVVISDNGSNGLTRIFLSQDPSITFEGTVDDSSAITHTLDLRAVSFDAAQLPRISFRGAVGSIVPLGGLTVTTEMRLDPNPAVPGTPAGTIDVGDNITTIGGTTFTGGGIDFTPRRPGAPPPVITSKDGVIEFFGPSGSGGANPLEGHTSNGNGITSGSGFTNTGTTAAPFTPFIVYEEALFSLPKTSYNAKVTISEPDKPTPCEVADVDECGKSAFN